MTTPRREYAVIADTHIRPPGESSSPWKTNLQTNERARWVLDQADRKALDLVIHLGDIIHPVPHQPSYAQAAQMAHTLLKALRAQVYTLPGNHDVGDKDNPNAPSFTVDRHGLDIYREWFGPPHQSFDAGGVHLVLINSPVLNSGLPEEAEQRRWLEADLEAHRGQRIHMFSHYPPYIVEPHEPGNYDNVDEPARSWLLGLMEEYRVEALFAGHVHQFGYNTYKETRIYNLLSTCFVRQDYSEMFRVEPADEYGRNDAPKLGWCTVKVHGNGLQVAIRRSYGATLVEGERGDERRRVEPPNGLAGCPSIGVHARHALTETMELPYNGPIDEFTRKTVRNDYPVLAMWETGIRHARLPLSDLSSLASRSRLRDLRGVGHRFGFFSVGPPAAAELETLQCNRDLVDFLEVILPWEKAVEHMPRVLEARDELRVPIYLANIESSVHREKGGPTFSHYISHGFNVEDKAPLEEFMSRWGSPVDGYTYQVGQGKSPWLQITDAAEYAERRDFTALVNVRLSSENPAEYLCDEGYVANRAAESLAAAYACPEARIFLDTFMDLDRGYFPRLGIYDRLWNPRRGARVLSNLRAALREDKVESVGVQAYRGLRVIEFKSDRAAYKLCLPVAGGRPDAAAFKLDRDATVIDLVHGLVYIGEQPPDPSNQFLAVYEG